MKLWKRLSFLWYFNPRGIALNAHNLNRKKNTMGNTWVNRAPLEPKYKALKVRLYQRISLTLIKLECPKVVDEELL